MIYENYERQTFFKDHLRKIPPVNNEHYKSGPSYLTT